MELLPSGVIAKCQVFSQARVCRDKYPFWLIFCFCYSSYNNVGVYSQQWLFVILVNKMSKLISCRIMLSKFFFQRIDENVHSQLREKLGDRLQRLQRGYVYSLVNFCWYLNLSRTSWLCKTNTHLFLNPRLISYLVLLYSTEICRCLKNHFPIPVQSSSLLFLQILMHHLLILTG